LYGTVSREARVLRGVSRPAVPYGAYFQCVLSGRCLESNKCKCAWDVGHREVNALHHGQHSSIMQIGWLSGTEHASRTACGSLRWAVDTKPSWGASLL